MKVTIVGPVFGSSGYSSHVRQLANAMHDIGIDVRLESPRKPGWEAGVNDAELRMLTKEPDSERTMIYVGTPPSWPIGIADNPKNFIGVLVWEGSKIPHSWLQYLLDPRVDQVWVPSNHVREAVINSIDVTDHGSQEKILTKIKIVPHGVDHSIFRPAESRPERPFTFVVNKGWAGGMDDRGGVQYAIQAYREEFKDDEKVLLFLRINPAYIPHHDHNVWLDEQMKLLGIVRGEGPRIEVSTIEVPYCDLVNAYHRGDVFVNACRAEGFGLTGIEAKACGLPTIQTGYGGQFDYMVEETDEYIMFELEPVTHDIAYEECEWATPNIVHLQHLMRYAFDHQEEMFANGVKAAEQSLSWSWREAAKKAKNFIESIPFNKLVSNRRQPNDQKKD